MKLGFACPVSLQRLRDLVADGDKLPEGYRFAPAADWVRDLMHRGHHVTVYTTAREVEEERTFWGEGISIRIANRRARGSGRDLFAAERARLTRMMLEDRCDVIHAHWTYEFALAAIASRLPTLITIHDLPWNVLRYFRDPYRAMRLLMAYEVALRGKHFTAVSEDAAMHFRRYLKPGAKITVIPNGLPQSVFDFSRPPRRRRNGGVTFATVLQGWSSQKNAAAALVAFRILRSSKPDSRLLMSGVDYEQHGPAQQWANRQALDQGVMFAGALPYQELLKRVSEEVDVLVYPSVNEAFSMTALEGMALKKPLIAGVSTPGMREMLAFGKCGILVDVRKPEEIARAMVRLAEDATLRNDLAESGFERASSLYRLNTVMTQYEDIYKRLPRA